jgi:hypothetical protein
MGGTSAALAYRATGVILGLPSLALWCRAMRLLVPMIRGAQPQDPIVFAQAKTALIGMIYVVTQLVSAAREWFLGPLRAGGEWEVPSALHRVPPLVQQACVTGLQPRSCDQHTDRTTRGF